jgi:nucleotide-binding universal stress UspA family protein
MYKHLLVPTDGSPLSDRAVKEAIALAGTLGARITLFYAIPAKPNPIYAESAVMAAYVPPALFAAQVSVLATKVLAKAAKKVQSAGVPVTTCQAGSDTPYEGVISTARKCKCDLIVMASHGRHGVSGFLLGSETQKVLTHTTLPVLVVR